MRPQSLLSPICRVEARLLACCYALTHSFFSVKVCVCDSNAFRPCERVCVCVWCVSTCRQSEMCEDEISCLDEVDSGHTHQTVRTYQVRGARSSFLFLFFLKSSRFTLVVCFSKVKNNALIVFLFDFDLSFKESSREVKFVVDIRRKFPCQCLHLRLLLI